ncbi:MAG: 50S ribosomal protein L29 [Chloroflexota bacterium]
MFEESSEQELKVRLEEAYQEQFNLRLRWATRQLTSTSELRKVKKKIAQFKTVLRERELNAAI